MHRAALVGTQRDINLIAGAGSWTGSSVRFKVVNLRRSEVSGNHSLKGEQKRQSFVLSFEQVYGRECSGPLCSSRSPAVLLHR